MSVIKCPKCNNEFINTNNKCTYCGFILNENQSKDVFIVLGNVLVNYQGVNKNIVIPKDIIEISSNAFINNKYIETVEFSDSVKVIGESAFENCTNLMKIINYNKVEYYKKNCFKNCGLIELEFNENTMDIGEEAFFGNNNLTTINYHPEKNIKLKRTFAKCEKLVNVICDKKYFFPSFYNGIRGDGRPTFLDAFWNTPYNKNMRTEVYKLYKKKICYDCGGKIKKGLFSARCKNCGIKYKVSVWL